MALVAFEIVRRIEVEGQSGPLDPPDGRTARPRLFQVTAVTPLAVREREQLGRTNVEGVRPGPRAVRRDPHGRIVRERLRLPLHRPRSVERPAASRHRGRQHSTQVRRLEIRQIGGDDEKRVSASLPDLASREGERVVEPDRPRLLEAGRPVVAGEGEGLRVRAHHEDGRPGRGGRFQGVHEHPPHERGSLASAESGREAPLPVGQRTDGDDDPARSLHGPTTRVHARRTAALGPCDPPLRLGDAARERTRTGRKSGAGGSRLACRDA